MPSDLMQYEKLAQEALRGLVKSALLRALEPDGLPGEHHFFITFRTGAPKVSIPERLVNQYPDEMTIVMKQHFWDLEVNDEGFSVGLSFDGKPESLRIPFSAVTRFFDPIAPFGLVFPAPDPAAPEDKAPEAEAPKDRAPSATGEVVHLDAFRKK